MDDDAFDRELAALLADPADGDTAPLSQAVLNRLAQQSRPQRWRGELAEVLSAPLPATAAFGALLALAMALGYALSPGLGDTGLLELLLFGDLGPLAGGLQ